VLWDFKNFGRVHWAWLIATVAVGAGCTIWYGVAAAGQHRLPGGASGIGMTFGVAAGLIFVFEFLLWPRKSKWLRTARWLLSTRTWMHAHLWLGLLTLPLVAMHSGLAVGGPFTLIFLVVYGLVFTSGVVGLILQNYLPRALLELVPQETVASQLEVVAQQLAVDARRILSIYVAGGEAPVFAEKAKAAAAKRQEVGAARIVGTVLPKTLHPAQTLARPVRSDEVNRAVVDVIEPYLTSGRDKLNLLGTKRRHAQYFDSLRRIAPPDLRDAVASLAELCERRRHLAVQERVHAWLHGWLLVHLPLSVVLMIMLAAHVYTALRFN
jgi:hypothetical protein